jgi:hypothetical protein
MSTATPAARRLSPEAGWARHAEALADWAKARMVARSDVFGAYYQLDDGTYRQYTADGPLTLEILAAHFRGERTIGLHSLSPDDQCKRVVADIDAHDDTASPEANLELALAASRRALDWGLTPILVDSNGKGGYHVNVLLKKPLPGLVAHWLVRQLIADHKDHGFSEPPECFPKQTGLSFTNVYGNWIRIPGKHHKRPHWSRVYCFDKDRWLEGEQAALYLIGHRGDDPVNVLAEHKAANPEAPRPQNGASRHSSNGSTVASDASDLELAPQILDAIAGDADGYDSWLSVGMCLHQRFDGSDAGLRLWDDWSRRSPKYTEGCCDAKWGGFQRGGALGFGTLIKRAEARGWRRPNERAERTASGGATKQPAARGEDGANDRPEFTNVRFAGDKKRAVDQPDLLASLAKITGGSIRRVGSGLFAHDGGDADLLQLSSSESLFAYVAQRARIYWGEGPSLTTKKQFFEAARQNAPQFEAVEKYPHFPPVPRVYYACSLPKAAGDGRALDGLLSLFSPATELDRELIRAFVLTLFWGGPPGKRPMFLAEGPADDPKNGRGVGKSDLFSILAKLVGNPFSNVSARDDISTITKRIINDTGRKRVLLLDNVKAERFSWGDLEALITAPTVSGHRLFVGEETRPNLIVYAMTMNGASLSEDLAQRVVMIRLARPDSYHRDGKAWEEHVSGYIDRHYSKIVADVMAAFNSPPQPIRAEQRWAEWTHKVLARCQRADELQQLLVERQSDINDDRMAARDFGQFLAAQVRREKRCDPAGAKVWFSAEALVPIVSAYTGEKVGQRAVSKKIGRMKPPELTKSDGKHARGWLWTGPKANPHSSPDRWVHAHPVPEEQEEEAEGPVF